MLKQSIILIIPGVPSIWIKPRNHLEISSLDNEEAYCCHPKFSSPFYYKASINNLLRKSLWSKKKFFKTNVHNK